MQCSTAAVSTYLPTSVDRVHGVDDGCSLGWDHPLPYGLVDGIDEDQVGWMEGGMFIVSSSRSCSSSRSTYLQVVAQAGGDDSQVHDWQRVV